LGDRAEVVLLDTGDATWALTAALPRRLDVYGGAARIWWPGLTREADPLDHDLYLIRDERGAGRAQERILASILGEAPTAATWAVGETSPPWPSPPSASPRGRSGDAAARVAAPDPWARIAAEYHVGDAVPARVFRLDPGFAIVELLPGAGVLVPLREIDYTWVGDPAEVLAIGDRVNVLLLELDPAARRGLASIKRALLATPREGLSLHPGGEPYLGAESVEETDAHLRRALQRERDINGKLNEELEAALDNRQRLARQCEEHKQQAATARKELKGAEERMRSLEAQVAADDPLASENSFLAAVCVQYARRLDKSDRSSRHARRHGRDHAACADCGRVRA